MQNSIIVHGPAACGKTRNGEAIAKKYNLTTVIEQESLGRSHPPARGALILSNLPVELLTRYELTLVPYKVAIEGIEVAR